MDDDREGMQEEAGLSLRLNTYDGRRRRSDGASAGNPLCPPPLAGLFKLETSSSATTSEEPSLTLGLPGDHRYSSSAKARAEGSSNACSTSRVVVVVDRRPAPPTISPPFSGRHLTTVKDAGSEEDEEEDGTARKKLRLSKEQSALLEDKFKEHTTLNPKQKQALARQLKLRPRQVEVWFQNRRARTKLKKTEVEYEFLKKCCETLREDNRRLHRELRELRSLSFSYAPAAAAFSVCPSCKKVTAGNEGDDESGSSSVVVTAPKPHLFNPFSHSYSTSFK
ncbi:homeobox-leucine zipper protein HAT22 [Canna indica]|uniref:Homeobox-leucine zipper protein HAT22 n=1 Tax=Canna indica TaxID=4628 RepID=A0AAQ3KXI8_9LILI|nr:homeobox-leucine zipper protein HAT22 [Canna indica]